MGFLDKMKQGMATAGQAMQMPTSADMEYAQRAQRLNATGVSTPATITALTPTGRTDAGGGSEYSIGVDVEPAGGGAYNATFTQYLLEGQVRSLNVGLPITVKVDPADPAAMLMM
jgi:hypothetical protein